MLFHFNTTNPTKLCDIPLQSLFVLHGRLYKKVGSNIATVIAWDADYDYDKDVVTRINNTHRIPIDLEVLPCIDATELGYPHQYVEPNTSNKFFDLLVEHNKETGIQ